MQTPVIVDELLYLVAKGCIVFELTRDVSDLRSAVRSLLSVSPVSLETPSMRNLIARAERIAHLDATVLLLGDPTPLPSKYMPPKAIAPTDTVLTFKPVVKKPVKRKTTYRGDLLAFMNKLAKIESNNNPKVVNRFGMMGKYQFSPRTLRLMGFKESKEEFLNNEQLQDSALVMYMKENRQILRNIIRKYDGTYHRGVYVTKSGILASAHLAGHGGVMAFFDPDKHDYATADANGTTVELYMTKFANYRIGF
jgi:hypothetical protein